jgi:hypothetical protein
MAGGAFFTLLLNHPVPVHQAISVTEVALDATWTLTERGQRTLGFYLMVCLIVSQLSAYALTPHATAIAGSIYHIISAAFVLAVVVLKGRPYAREDQTYGNVDYASLVRCN